MAEMITLADGTSIPVDFVPKGADPHSFPVPPSALPPAGPDTPPPPTNPATGWTAPLPDPIAQQLGMTGPPAPPEVWCAYGPETILLFTSELEALRAAVGHGYDVGQVKLNGQNIFEQLGQE